MWAPSSSGSIISASWSWVDQGLVSAYGVSANPWNHAHLAGGSSGSS